MSDFLGSVVQIIDRGRNTNSYKFALLRALADWGKARSPSSNIGDVWLIERFLEYYWPLTLRFRVPQSIDPAKKPKIMNRIHLEATARNLKSSLSLCRFRRRFPAGYKQLVHDLREDNKWKCLPVVIPCLHNLRDGAKVRPALYDDRYAQERIVTLRPGVLDFLKNYSRSVELLAVGAWVKFTEKYSTAPHLYEKISGVPKQRSVQKHRQVLVEIQGARCFYCSLPTAKPHVEHVIPWSFMLEDKLWNLVLSCEDCNLEKADRVPARRFVGELTKRNESLLASKPEGSSRARALLREWADRDLSGHIELRWEACRAAGFGVWPGPKGCAVSVSTGAPISSAGRQY